VAGYAIDVVDGQCYPICGDGIRVREEQCDSGRGCGDDCICIDYDSRGVYYWTPNASPDTNCDGPYRLCGNRELDPREECDGGVGCLAYSCLCDHTQGWYPIEQSFCAQDNTIWYAIGHPESFVFFWGSQYCHTVNLVRRFTRFPWVTFNETNCLEDPLHIQYMGLRRLPIADWDALKQMTWVISYSDDQGIDHAVVNSDYYCNNVTTMDTSTLKVSENAERVMYPGNSHINSDLFWEVEDVARTIKLKTIWACDKRGCNRTIVVKNVSPFPIHNLDIQMSYEYEITPTPKLVSMKFGGDIDATSPLFGYGGVGYVRDSELIGDGTHLRISPFVVGNRADICWPDANVPYDWPNVQTSQPQGPCAGGCSSQIHLAKTLEPEEYVTIKTSVMVFADVRVADLALTAENPLFYCMGSHTADLFVPDLPARDRQVISTFTYMPELFKNVDEPLTCPCKNGTCTMGDWGGSCVCADGYWGEFCEHPCLCKNDGVCDPLTGHCTCTGGHCGVHCEYNACTTCQGWCNTATCECFCSNNKHGKDCNRDFVCSSTSSAETSVKGVN